VTATESAIAMAKVAAQAAADKLAKDVLLVDVSDRLAITDIFVIVTGANERQVSAIVDEVEVKMREAGVKPVRREGERDGRWVLLDFLDVVVHVQHSEERVFYALDRLWKDCPTIPWVDADAPAEDDAAAGAPAVAADPDEAGTDDPTNFGHDPADFGYDNSLDDGPMEDVASDSVASDGVASESVTDGADVGSGRRAE
jgi:ribosome-associated protein